MEAEYDTAKKNYDEAPKMSQVVLDTLDRVGSMQTEEVRLLLERELGMISQRAFGLIDQTITKTLENSGMSLRDVDIGHSTRSAPSGVSVVQYPDWATGTERVTRSYSLAVPSWEMEISVTNYKNPLLRERE